MADHTSDNPAIKTLISRVARFEPINLTALMLNELDNNPQRQQRLESRARIILETALEWFPKPSLVLSSTNMQHFEKRAKAFAAACNFLADNSVVLDEVIYDKEMEAEKAEEEEEWEGFASPV
jgi:ribonuclease D